MDATITLGPGAISGGSSLLDGLLSTLYYADTATIDFSTATAIAQTQPEEDGFDGKVTFTGTVQSQTSATITGLTVAYNSGDGYVDEFSVSGLSIDGQTMLTAIQTSDPDPETQIPNLQPLIDIFQGINWTMDASQGEKGILAYGTGGDDHFTLTKFNDLLERDGGDDIVDMGAGNDTVFFGNPYGFSADHTGHAAIDGGKGSDTLAFFVLNNKFLGDYASVTADAGIVFDLQKGTVNLKGSDTFKFNHYYNFENVNGSDLADTIVGTIAANKLDGSGGNDEITGRGGKDVLTGGLGEDDFNFVAAGDSKAGKKHDVITDFEHKVDDIDLSKLHSGAKNDKFHFVEDGKLKHVGDLHFVLHDEKGTAHDYTMVEANLKGDAKPELQIELTGIVHLDKGDFIL